MMAGCDHLPSVKGIGIIKTINLFDKYVELDRVIDSLWHHKIYE